MLLLVAASSWGGEVQLADKVMRLGAYQSGKTFTRLFQYLYDHSFKSELIVIESYKGASSSRGEDVFRQEGAVVAFVAVLSQVLLPRGRDKVSHSRECSAMNVVVLLKLWCSVSKVEREEAKERHSANSK